MKRIFISLLILFFSLSSMRGNGLSALLTYSTFNTPDNKAYVETYISVLGSTAFFIKNASGKMQASIEIGITFSQAGVIKAYKKYTLLSPEVADTVNAPQLH